MSSKQNILFRADSSSSIGIGHIMRDLVLAKQFEGSNIIFACMELEGNIINQIPYQVIRLKSNHIDEMDTIIKEYKIDMIVIDHYGIDEAYEKQLKTQNSKLKILSFDDTYEKHYCDILLNHNIYAQKEKYINLVPKECEVRCGEKYTLIRDEFLKVNKRLTRKNKLNTQPSIFKIFIAMGGADTANLNLNILKILRFFGNIEVHILTTQANKNLKELIRYTKNKKWVKLHINSNQVAKILAQCDLAIITPSVTVHEVMTLGIDFIAIKTASNQGLMYKYLKAKRYLVLEKFVRYSIYNYLKSIIMGDR
ncbi:UDP-2,4-diacetamido-2,4,6-trideoxy-beta-L-altropyranose hydrolase [Arcobacter sp. FWKO B]|uniref:UDP-2,4-diacetamido-2,4, 6-trideoxy-beta-L-altropyranose hydrolase n=1 Tax=Arcobacter sp. FWKO B TaxID=2593672 RepID=UPI0018A65658|nr:UDP-2,4-diacetamido-2,4,6-trideoxy-beta-L-altropyranose hydrolase [Arcobacter sp. FWKO B]QOG12150.1 UDP-2,4-diacetamido-2,4,6-trideoxy-beta-L-altropyranose hydrolase [Arcobacter sp. FWKO B]